MIRLNQGAVKLALALLVLTTGCMETQQQQVDLPSSPQPSVKSTPLPQSPQPSVKSTPLPQSPQPPVKSTPLKEEPSVEKALPRADANGDYSGKVGHQQWIVVDPDPNGVNCRWSEQMPTAWYAPDAKLPTLNISQWPVVRRFTKNTPSQTLTANVTPGGFATLNDGSGKPWLKVSIGSDNQICLVRANSKYVQPVR